LNGWDVFYKTCIVLLTLLGGYLLWQLGQIVLVLFAAIIFASAIRPLVEFLVKRKIHQGVAVLLIYLLTFGTLLGLLIVTIPPLADFTIDLLAGDLLVRQVQEFMGAVLLFVWQNFRIILPVMVVPEQLRELMRDANDSAMVQALPVARNTATVIGQLLLAVIMSFYWLTTRQPLLNLLLRLSPLHDRERTSVIWNDIEQTLGAYVRAQIIMIVTIGVAAYIGLLLLRVPYALPLAVVAGLTEAIPIVGPIFGAIPAVLIAFSINPVTGLLVAGWYILIQQLEANILVPKLMESQIGLNPLLVIVAIIAGATLNGIVGALLAIPVAGAVQVIARHVLIEPALAKQYWRATDQGMLLDEQGEEGPPPPIIRTSERGA
jgi:predicted PurR-regulated permease PerM